MVTKTDIQSIDQWYDSYSRRIMPFVVLSLVIHLVVIGGIVGYRAFFAGGKGLDVLLFNAGADRGLSASQPLLGGFDAPERIKIFRVDFFSRIIPWIPPPPDPVEIIDPALVTESPEVPAPEEVVEPEPVEEPEPELSVVVGEILDSALAENAIPLDDDPEALANDLRAFFGSARQSSLDGSGLEMSAPKIDPRVPQPEIVGSFDDRTPIGDALGLFDHPIADSSDENVFPLPEWEFSDINGVRWLDNHCYGNYTIYLISDISTRHGLEDILSWNYVLRQLITNPYAAWPPNVVTIAAGFNNPYEYDDEHITDILKESSLEENTFGLMIPDSEGRFAKSLGYSELPQPIVIFADSNSYIRLIMIGRVRDIRSENIQAATGVIAEMWNWTETEQRTMPTVVTALLNMLSETAYNQANRLIPPEAAAIQRFPEWGYPSTEIPGNAPETGGKSDQKDTVNAPF